MGQPKTELNASKASEKLRPVKDVLNRLQYDAAYNVEDYVVGYIDRKTGTLEKPVLEYLPDNLVVWDRARKVDLVFRR